MQQPPDARPLILVVDDHDLVREFVVNVVVAADMQVLEAVSGAEAVARMQAHQAAIDGVLLDLSMPDMSGAQTLRRLRQINPDIPVLLMSAHDEGMGRQAMHDHAGVRFVQKPFQPAGLIEAIHALLEDRSPAQR